MKEHFLHIKLLIKRLVLLLILFEVTRVLFFIFNYSVFKSISFTETLSVLFWGLRFDFAAIFYLNSVFILLHLIPGGFKEKKSYQLLLKIIFLFVNALALLMNFVDCAYFEYLGKRSTADFFKLFGMGNDVANLLPQYIKDFWYVALLWIATLIAAWFFYPKIKQVSVSQKQLTIKNIFIQTGISVLLIGLFFSIARGWELKPLRIISAVEYTDARYASLLLNTPFTILNTYNIEQIEDKKYFPEEELDSYFNPVKQFQNTEKFTKKNVVVIILESFSRAYIGALNNNKGHTPFLDSLIKKSLCFTNAYANGKRSIEALPSIIASLPPLMSEPFISSNYSANHINSLAGILKKEGYKTAFFHGGDNGTMGFDLFAKSAGFEEYCGRKEYNNEKDYDGNWGIFDEPFMNFFVEKMNNYKEPFFTCLFTLSSHHPYSVPEKYKNKFQGGELDILKSIEYTDFALSEFFREAEKKAWFNNTLFIITADHTAPVIEEHYKTKTGMFAIPIIYYAPGDTAFSGFSERITQQIDIMPSVLDYLNYKNAFVGFGNSVFDTTNTFFAINFLDDYYQFIQNNFVLHFNGEKPIALYDIQTDSLMKENILLKNQNNISEMEQKLKAIIQSFNNRMITNKLALP